MFLLFLKRKETTFKKVVGANNFLFSAYVTGATCFDECFLLHVITGTHQFS